MQVLQDEGKLGLALVAMPRLADGAGNRVEEEGSIIRLAVVVAGGAKREREDENQERGRQRPPRRLDQRRVERGQVRSPLVVAVDPGGPGRVDGEAAQD